MKKNEQMKHFIVVVILAIGFLNCNQPQSYDLALSNVKLFNSRTKTVLDHQTVLINEYRLNMMDPKARDFLKTEMEKFLFGDGSEKPGCFEPNPEDKK